MANITLLPSAKVPLIYDGELTMTTEWYRFFWNIYGFTEAGVIPVSKGGTGLSTIGNRQLIIGNASNVFEPALLSSTSIAITYPVGFVNLELSTSGVTPGTYGSASQVGVFTVNQYGVLTAASNTSIGINASQIISGTIASARISGSYTGITGVGTLIAGTWNATTIGTAYGGTGQTSFTDGQLLIGNTTGNTLTKATLTAGSGVSIINGAGTITISATGSGGTVTAVTGVAPIASSGGTTPAISISQSNTTTDGYLSSTDWNTFNNKQPAGSYLTAVSVVSANGFAGTSSGGTTPALTLSTSITGILKGNGTAISAATSGTDYAPATSGSSILYGNGAGGFSNVTIGTGVSFAGGTLSATGTGGTVTSVSGTGTVNGITLTGTVTSSGSLTLGGTLGGIGNSQLTNSTISGVALGGNLFNLTAGTGVSFSAGTTYNGSAAITINATGTGGTVTSVAQSFTGGLISVSGSPITTSGTLALTVAGTSGGIPYFSSATTWASSAALAANALVIGGGAGAAPSTITTGTGVVTALGVNTGTAGAFVVNGGALGTPSSGTVTNLTGTASININGTVGATTATTGLFTTLGASGVATFSAGTALLPAITTTGDTNTGIFFPAADTIAFTEGGVESMRIDSSGNVGIGNASPSSFGKVVVQSSGTPPAAYVSIIPSIFSYGGNFESTLYLGLNRTDVRANGRIVGYRLKTESVGDTNADLTFEAGVGNFANAPPSSYVARMRIDGAGNVGIATTSPACALDVNGIIRAQGATISASGAGVEVIYTSSTSWFGATNQGIVQAYNRSGAAFTPISVSGSQIGFVTGGTERMRITSAGDVGIATNSPATYGRFAVQSIGVPPTAYLSVLGTGFTYAGGFESSIYLGNYRTDVLNNGQVAGWRFKNSTTNQFGGSLVFQAGSSAVGANAPPSTFTTYMTLDTGGSLTVTGAIVSGTTSRTAGYTVATLPAAGTVGRTAYVTDATAPTFLGALVGGGAVRCPVFDNGTAWVAG